MGTGPAKGAPCSGRLSHNLATEAASRCGAASTRDYTACVIPLLSVARIAIDSRDYFRVDFRVASSHGHWGSLVAFFHHDTATMFFNFRV